MKDNILPISDYDYPLPDERIARFPLQRREASKLLLYRGGGISETCFGEIAQYLPEGSMLVFNNTRVIRARLIFFKETGARIEVFCLEPRDPADYERAFAVKGRAQWSCIVGNLKKWKGGDLRLDFQSEGHRYRLSARRIETANEAGRESPGNPTPGEQLVEFTWDADLTFGQLLEVLGRIPIPPYLCRESEELDNSRYQTVYSRYEGSVAAPTAGLHFTPELIDDLRRNGITTAEVTLHVGAGTFLPVKEKDALLHPMHTEHFEIGLGAIRDLIRNRGHVIAVGTTSVRTLESLAALGYRVLCKGEPDLQTPVGQWEIYDMPGGNEGKPSDKNDSTADPDSGGLLEALARYLELHGIERLKASTRIMIRPGYRFRVVNGIITNFHQPRSTLLLLVAAFVGEDWRRIYDYALENRFRFLSYGDSTLLLPDLPDTASYP